MLMSSLDNNNRLFSKEQMEHILKSEDYEIRAAIRLLENSIRSLKIEEFHDKENKQKYIHWAYLARCQLTKLNNELTNREDSLKNILYESIDLHKLLIEAAQFLDA